MTIAAGFRCADGVLLASDTLYSSDRHQFGPKLWVLREDDPTIVFGGSGIVGTLLRARDEIGDRFSGGESVSQVVQMMDEVLDSINKRFPSSGYPKLQTLVGIKARDGQAKLYENVAGEIALSPLSNQSTCVGVDSLGNYFADLLFRDAMNLKWAKVVAAHLVLSCKTYAAGYCGGDTHFIEIPHAGAVRVITDQAIVRDLEAHLSGLTEIMRLVLAGDGVTEATVARRLNRLRNVLREVELTTETSAPGSAFDFGRSFYVPGQSPLLGGPPPKDDK
jgi:hypothetical protein